ncbi:hypothetical protein MKX03_033022 [Papaver bracteatum]|nr:hypothetical protein MKX03_033022 [Papaver bracteatum]
MASLHDLLKFQCLVLLLLRLQILASAQIPSTAYGGIAKPGCQSLCGNVRIPYPFGIGVGCYKQLDFKITCFNGEPKYDRLNVTNISLLDGEMTIEAPIATSCLEKRGRYIYESYSDMSFELGTLTVSPTKNKFISIGCDTSAEMKSKFDLYGQHIGEGCSDCSKKLAISDGSCNGMGCCMTSIRDRVTESNVTIRRPDSLKNVSFDNSCVYAFIAEEKSFRFSSTYLQDFKNNGTGRVPVVLDWNIGFDRTCINTECGPNTFCTPANNDGNGYLCTCKPGYTGNPYLTKSSGGHCQGGISENGGFPQSKFNKIVAGKYLPNLISTGDQFDIRDKYMKLIK